MISGVNNRQSYPKKVMTQSNNDIKKLIKKS
jgi:hypothetical protein